MANYRDESSFGTGSHTINEIAEAIRHKKYGVDVREAMAQGFETIYSYDQRVLNVMETLQKVQETHAEDVNSLRHSIYTNADNIGNLQSALSTANSKIEANRVAIHNLEIDVNNHIEATNKRLDALEKAVFGTDTVEITSPVKPDNSDLPLIEINTNRKEND